MKSSKKSSSSENKICSICSLKILLDEDYTFKTCCKTYYHASCVYKIWTNTTKACPNCKSNFKFLMKNKNKIKIPGSIPLRIENIDDKLEEEEEEEEEEEKQKKNDNGKDFSNKLQTIFGRFAYTNKDDEI